MTASIVKIHGRLFARFDSPSEPIGIDQAHCTCQTCGTMDGIVPSDWDYEGLTAVESKAIQALEPTTNWWKSPAGRAEQSYRKERKANSDRELAEWRAREPEPDTYRQPWERGDYPSCH